MNDGKLIRAAAAEMLEALLLVRAAIKEWDFGENDYTLADLIIGTPVEKAVNDAIDHAEGKET